MSQLVGGHLAMHDFHVTGQPAPQPRPRFTCRGGIARAYEPKNTRISRWKDVLRLGIGSVEERIECAVQVDLEFLLPRPKSHLLRGAVRETAPAQPIAQTNGDLDNYAKPVLDICTELGIWTDDAQVTALTVTKRYAQPGEDPGVNGKVRPATH